MRHVPEGLRQMPGRLRVGRIALVKYGKHCRKRRVAQILVKLRKLPWREQALVHDCLRRKRADVTACRQKRLGPLAKQRQSPLKARRSARGMKRLEKKLPSFRHGLERQPPQRIGVHRNAPPPKDSQPLDIRGRFYRRSSFRCCRRRKKRKAKPEDLRKSNSLLLRSRAEESVRNRGQQAGAVTAGAIRVHTAAMGQPFQRG